MGDELTKSHLPWPVRVGRRVAVRRRLLPSDPTGAVFTDVTGELLRADGSGIEVDSRHGRVRVEWADVVAAKEIPPKASRRGHPHRTVPIDDLQRLMVDGLPPLTSEHLGDWLLRSAEGFTGRANSVLAVGDSGFSPSDAVDRCVDWYARLGLPALFQIAGPVGFDPSDHPVVAEIDRRGGRCSPRVAVMTAAVREIALARSAIAVTVDATTRPTDQWWRAASPRTIDRRTVAARVLAGVEDGRYLTLCDTAPRANTRLAYSPGWVGLFDLHVAEAFRGKGFGRTLVGAAAREADRRGVRSMYLQVSSDNAPAIGLYESLGFSTHHEYIYARL